MGQEDLEAIRAGRAERAKQDAAEKAVGKAKRGQPKKATQTDEGQGPKKRDSKRKSAAVEEADVENQGADV